MIHDPIFNDPVWLLDSELAALVLVLGDAEHRKAWLDDLEPTLRSREDLQVVRIRAGDYRTAYRMQSGIAELLELPMGPYGDSLSVLLAGKKDVRPDRHRGKVVALLIDDGQDLKREMLDLVQEFWNWSTWDAECKRMTAIFLAGEPLLVGTLQSPRHKSLKSRVTKTIWLGKRSVR